MKSVSLKKGEEKDTFDNINRGYLIEVGMVEAGETLASRTKREMRIWESAFTGTMKRGWSMYTESWQRAL